MSVEDIKKEIRNCSPEELKDLRDWVTDYISYTRQEKYTNLLRERKNIMVECMSEITGIPPKDFFKHTKADNLPIIRYIIMNQLYDEGFSSVQTARVFKLSHATMLLGRKKILYILENPKQWPDIVEINKKFKTKLEERNTVKNN